MDPDYDQVEAIAWWDPDLLTGNPAIRAELLDSLPDVLTALGHNSPTNVEKAGGGDADPKAPATGPVGARMSAPPTTGRR